MLFFLELYAGKKQYVVCFCLNLLLNDNMLRQVKKNSKVQAQIKIKALPHQF